MGDYCLMPNDHYIFQLYHGENKFHFDEMAMMSIFIVCVYNIADVVDWSRAQD